MARSRPNVFVTALLLNHVFAAQLVEPTSKDNSDECNCYLVSGTDPGYFQYHRFWDFRNIPNDGGNDFTSAPALITDDENSGGQGATSAYFETPSFQADWNFLNGTANSKSVFPSVYTPQNVYISRNTTDGAESATYLTMRASRLDSFVSCSQLNSNQDNLLYASLRTRLRVIPNGLSNATAPSVGDVSLNNTDSGSNDTHPVDEGAVIGFFIYQSDTQESDIEILTQDSTDQIRYSNQPDYIAATDSNVPGASTQLVLPNNVVWTDWTDHRFDWFNGTIRWYANEFLVLEKTTNTPTHPSALMMNVWGDGGYWSGNMTVGGQVTAGIQWVQMVFNVSGDDQPSSKRTLLPRDEQQMCKLGCNVDGVKEVGFPEMAFNSTSESMAFRLLDDGFSCGFMVCGLAILTTMLLTLG